MSRAIKALPKGDTGSLKGRLSHLRKLRVGDWRVFFEQDDGQRVVRVVRVAHRSVAYD